MADSKGNSVIIKSANLWWVKCNPAKPEPGYSANQPARWSLQIKTTDKKVKDEWKALGLDPKLKEEKDGSGVYYCVNLRKNAVKSSGEPNSPVEFKTGKLAPLDPSIVGNGSVANIRVWQSPYTVRDEKGAITKEGTRNTLMAVQVTKLNMYTPKEREDDFSDEGFEVNEESTGDTNNADIPF
jgi:hypothetical protein